MKPIKWIFTLLVFIGLGTLTLHAQLKYELHTEIIVYFKPDSFELPQNSSGKITRDLLKLNGKGLKETFLRFKVKSAEKGFPDFRDEDTKQRRYDGVEVTLPDFSRIFRIQLSDKLDVDSAIAALNQLPSVLYAEKNLEPELDADPDYATKQWHLNNTGQSGGTAGSDIKAEQAWQIFTGSSAVKIGIIDTGVEITHEDLSGKSSGDTPTPNDFHGTHVAGIAAAKANNDKGGRGVDWNAQIISKRIWEPAYVGDMTAAAQISSAVNAGADVLNHSWSGPAGNFTGQTLRMAFAYAYKMNRVSVASMGNTGSSQVRYPAALGQGIIAVGATTDNDTKSSYSTTGNHIDVTAPGGASSGNQHDIWSTWGNNSYGYLAGTSMATPAVTGIVSLLKGYNSTLYNDDIERIIQLSADDKYTPGWDNQYGYGRVNAKKALDYLRAPYLLDHYTATGGTDLGASSSYTMGIYGATGLVDGNYSVKRHEVQRYVTFPDRIEIQAWGDGAATTGWANVTPNMTMGWCDVVPGTLTNYSATLRTYVYEVYSGGYFIGWYPCAPNSVSYTYTVLGKPVPSLSVTINGPGCVLSKGANATLTAIPSGGTGQYSYSWSPGGYTTQSITRPVSNCPTTWTVTVTSGTQTATASHSVNYQGSGCDCGGELEKKIETSVVPDKFELMQNYPNPFNPTTTLKFSVPEATHVVLRIYNVQGQEIRTLVDNHLDASYYEVKWDGTDSFGNQVASGIYFYRIQAGKFVESKKMTFLK